MLNCCCDSIPSCGGMTNPCSVCADSEDVYVLSVYYMYAFSFEILVDGVSIGFVYPKKGSHDDCQAKYFITDVSVTEEIKNDTCFISHHIRKACLPYPEFQVVDKNIFRKEIINITIRPLPSNQGWWNDGMLFYLYRRSKTNGQVCTIFSENYRQRYDETYSYLNGNLSTYVRQTICPTVPCRPCSSVKDNYVMSIGGSGGNRSFFDAFPYIGEVGTFEFFVDGVSLFSKTLFGGRCYSRLLVDDIRIAAKANFNLPCHFLWPREQIETVVDKAFFLKDFLNVSAKFTPKFPDMNIHMSIVVSRLQEGSEYLCPVAGAGFFAGKDYPQLPYEQAFSLNMKLCPPTLPVLQ